MGLPVSKPEQSWANQDSGQPGCEMQEASDRAQQARFSEPPPKLNSEHDR